jgi:aminoglycoside 3-N-acetyltransferase
VVTEVSITSDRFDELGADFERDRPVVRGRVGAADVRLFPVADAVAYAQRWLALHRPREEWAADQVRGPARPDPRPRP